MKNWIRVIVALNSRLDALTEKIDEEVSLMSTSLYEPTMDLINDIIALNDKKVKLINLRILHDTIKDALLPNEYILLKKVSTGHSFAELAERTGINKGNAYRLFCKCADKAAAALGSLGFTSEKLGKEYNDVPIVRRLYLRLNKEVNSA